MFVGEAFQPRFAQEGRGWKAAITGISTRKLNRIRLLCVFDVGGLNENGSRSRVPRFRVLRFTENLYAVTSVQAGLNRWFVSLKKE